MPDDKTTGAALGDEPKTSTTDYACAGERHFADGSHLYGRGRLLNADHLFGLAVECLMKSLLERFAGASGVSRKDKGGNQSDRLWWKDPGTNKSYTVSHINKMRHLLPLLLDGRPGPALTEALTRVSADYEQWLVDDRYTDGAHLDEPLLTRRQEAAVLAHDLYLHVQFTGKLP
ncbi:hypothetical protein ACFWOL_18445 [Streptomyces sp. NPDC058442]|uniref:hypothetical protein n=1 Tax=Streptomyces sp. NPDC058442 TaxID=3346503 RepID=UPI0036477040